VTGVSGGVGAVVPMMYGASLRDCFENVKDMALRVRQNPKEYVKMRRQMISNLKDFWRDGSLEHPAFKEGRVEVCFTETSAKSPIWWASMLRRATEKRVSHFRDPAEAAMMMIASASAYFSGLPFLLKGDDEESKKVADGGLTDNLPLIDESTITLKPFTDGFDITHLTGRTADITPSEFVPINYAVYPPNGAMLEHLFELGYRDMEAWLDAHLEERVAQIKERASSPLEDNRPPVEFTCSNQGTEWIEQVLASLPVRVRDQVRKLPDKSSRPAGYNSQHPEDLEKLQECEENLLSAPAVHGWLDVTASVVEEHKEGMMQVAKARRWFTFDALGLSWGTSPSDESHPEVTHEMGIREKFEAESGRLPLAWISHVSKHPEQEKEFSIDSADGARLMFVAESSEDADHWVKELTCACRDLLHVMSKLSL